MSKATSIRYLLYFLLWVGYFFIQYYFLSYPFDTWAAMVLALRIVVIHIFIFYFNSLLLLPGLLDKSKYFLYFMAVAGLVVTTFYIFSITNQLSVIQEALETGRPRFGRGISGFKAFRSRIFTSNMIASMAVLFLSTVYWVVRRERQRKQQEMDMVHENLQTEMKFLKSQINPHFLLNALNNIYSLSNIKSAKTSEMIMRLSEMLKYVLYEANAKAVALRQEMKYIDDFISFQKLKFEYDADISVDYSKADPQHRLAPMVLIPFIENSFKHSSLDDEKGYVRIVIRTTDNSLTLKVENSTGRKGIKDKTGGIGLENVRRRMDLLYPGRHSLFIDSREGIYLVELTLYDP